MLDFKFWPWLISLYQSSPPTKMYINVEKYIRQLFAGSGQQPMQGWGLRAKGNTGARSCIHPGFSLSAISKPLCGGIEPKQKQQFCYQRKQTGVWSYHSDWDLRGVVLDRRELQRTLKNLHKNSHRVLGWLIKQCMHRTRFQEMEQRKNAGRLKYNQEFEFSQLWGVIHVWVQRVNALGLLLSLKYHILEVRRMLGIWWE